MRDGLDPPGEVLGVDVADLHARSFDVADERGPRESQPRVGVVAVVLRERRGDVGVTADAGDTVADVLRADLPYRQVPVVAHPCDDRRHLAHRRVGEAVGQPAHLELDGDLVAVVQAAVGDVRRVEGLDDRALVVVEMRRRVVRPVLRKGRLGRRGGGVVGGVYDDHVRRGSRAAVPAGMHETQIRVDHPRGPIGCGEPQ